MNISEIKSEIKKSEYDFLEKNEHLGKNIILLGLGGSHAYGTLFLYFYCRFFNSIVFGIRYFRYPSS